VKKHIGIRKKGLFPAAGIAGVSVILAVLCCGGCAKASSEPYDLDKRKIQAAAEYLCGTIGIRAAGTREEETACDWLWEQLEEMGFEEEGSLERTRFLGFQNQSSENLTAVCNAEYDGPLFSIVAHYDSVESSCGAADNAASVGVLLEIARFLGPENPDFPCEIRLVFLGSEENGYHGSSAYVESLSDEERARHLGAYNMDISAAAPSEHAVLVCNTLGAVQDGIYIEGDIFRPADNLVSSSVANAYQKLYGGKLGGIFHVGESDQVSFHKEGLDAANVCWRRVENGMPHVPSYYHQMTDTPDILDYETARITGRCILEAVHSAAVKACLD